MIKECMDHTAATEEEGKDCRSGYYLPFKINSNCYFSNVLPTFLRIFMFFSCRCTMKRKLCATFCESSKVNCTRKNQLNTVIQLNVKDLYMESLHPEKKDHPSGYLLRIKKLIYDSYNVCVMLSCFPFQYLFLGFKKAQLDCSNLDHKDVMI